MRERFFASAALRDGELRGALVQLCGHLDGFVRRTTERDEQLRELLEFGFGHSNKFNHGWTQMDTDKNKQENIQ